MLTDACRDDAWHSFLRFFKYCLVGELVSCQHVRVFRLEAIMQDSQDETTTPPRSIDDDGMML